MEKMRKLLLVVVLFAIGVPAACSPKDSLLESLFSHVGRKEHYTRLKEERIEQVKLQLQTPNLTCLQRYDINRRLADEYKPFISDSATTYLLQNYAIALSLDDRYRTIEAKLQLASQYVIRGMYLDAGQLLQSIDRRGVPDGLLNDYYDAYKSLCIFYSFDNAKEPHYRELSDRYRDSLMARLSPGTIQYRLLASERSFDAGRYDEAEAELLPFVEHARYETREDAMVAYSLAKVCDRTGDAERQKSYLAQAAIADIRCAVKENAAMQMLADLLYRQGDIDNAYRCIRSSMEDAMFCNARMRTFEISKIFPIIDSAYQEKNHKEKTTFKTALVVFCVLSLFLLSAVIGVMVQMRRMVRMREAQRQTNCRLKALNDELTAANRNLEESNLIKTAYITEFLDACSKYIDKLDSYRRTLYRASSAGKHQEVFRMLRSTERIDAEVEELCANFDRVFLHLFPDFVEQFNRLLQQDKRFEVKSGALNTELRIFALIRLGITDSSAIARFLRYSPTTIYNYRTRVRNRALVSRDDLEQSVMRIG